MPLEIIPSIDLRGGKAVWFQTGDGGAQICVAADPIVVARRFVSEGAVRLQINDLDGARTGDPQNLVALREIVKRVPELAIQIGGGIRTAERVGQVLHLGAARVIVGSAVAAADDISLVSNLLLRYEDRIVIAVEAENGYLPSRSWEKAAAERVEDFGLRLARLGASRFLYHDLAAPAVSAPALAAFARTVGRPVLVADGVSSVHEINILANLQPRGVEGVIIGKSLFTGALTVFDALQVALDTERRLRVRTRTPAPIQTSDALPDWVRDIQRG
jgi:phosphoribosylformimino-5-aminoimidazole carboxamide ribotide isomerase